MVTPLTVEVELPLATLVSGYATPPSAGQVPL